MPDPSPDPDLPPDLGKPTRGDVRKLAAWISELKRESDPSQSPFSPDRLRLLLKGRSKTSQQIFRNFDRWLEKRSADAKAEVARVAAAAEEERASATPTKIESGLPPREPTNSQEVGHIQVVLYDLRADASAMARSRAGSALNWSNFAGVEEIVALPTDQDTTYFDLFEQLADFSPSEASTHTLFLEGGATLNADFPAVAQSAAAVTLLRDENQPFYERDQLLRWFAFPQSFGGLLVKNEFLARRSRDWSKLWHLAPWTWALHELEALEQSATPVIDREPHDHDLSATYRRWLAQHRPETINELREPLAEWGSLLHDLVGAVVADHPGYFETNAAYLAATAATGVRR